MWGKLTECVHVRVEREREVCCVITEIKHPWSTALPSWLIRLEYDPVLANTSLSGSRKCALTAVAGGTYHKVYVFFMSAGTWQNKFASDWGQRQEASSSDSGALWNKYSLWPDSNGNLMILICPITSFSSFLPHLYVCVLAYRKQRLCCYNVYCSCVCTSDVFTQGWTRPMRKARREQRNTFEVSFLSSVNYSSRCTSSDFTCYTLLRLISTQQTFFAFFFYSNSFAS